MTHIAASPRAAAGAAIAAATGVGNWLARQAIQVAGFSEPQNRWLVVTVNCPPDRLSGPDALPEPISRLAGIAEHMVRPAPGGRGTEIGLRLRGTPPSGLPAVAAWLSGNDPRGDLRSALRDAKSLIETGEVICPDEPPVTHPTPAGRVLDLAVSRAAREGRL